MTHETIMAVFRWLLQRYFVGYYKRETLQAADMKTASLAAHSVPPRLFAPTRVESSSRQGSRLMFLRALSAQRTRTWGLRPEPKQAREVVWDFGQSALALPTR